MCEPSTHDEATGMCEPWKTLTIGAAFFILGVGGAWAGGEVGGNTGAQIGLVIGFLLALAGAYRWR